MKKFLFLLISLFIISSSGAQTKYLIYLKDKGVMSKTSLQKSSPLFKSAVEKLSPQAIDRRKQVMGDDNYIAYEDLPLYENYVREIEASGIKIENQLKWFNSISAYLNEEQVNFAKSLSFVEKVERVKGFKIDNPVNEKPITQHSISAIQSQVGLDYGPSLTQNNLSEIPAVHDLGINGGGVIIGLLDTGFRWKTHSAFKNLKVAGERDFIQKDDITANQAGDLASQDAHGTSVLSIIGANESGRLIGPAFNATYYLAKTEDVGSEKHVEEDNYAAALEWMESKGVQITSSSLGYNIFDPPEFSYSYADMNGKTTIVAKAANLAFERGISTFTAAGNEGSNNWGKIISPADAFNIISVGAVDSRNIVVSFSSRGPTSDGRIKPEILAMGASVVNAAASTGNYSSGNGTSYAAPIAAGVAALLKSTFPHLTNHQIRKIFLECGDNSAQPNNDRGYGLISAKKVIAFPNLQQQGDVFRLNKIFYDPNGIKPNTAKVYYKIGSQNFQSANLNSSASSKYYFDFPAASFGETIEFYFTYQTDSGTLVLEPLKGNFKFAYGNLNITAISSGVKDILPTEFRLHQNYPNPFNPSTTIKYQIAVASKVQLKVYDLLGRDLATLVDELQQPGIYNSQFSIRNYQLPSGVYFYTLRAGNFSQTKKMMILK